MWRVCDLFYATVSIFFPKYGLKTKEVPENEHVLSYNVIKVLDPRVYDFILSPFLTLIYFLGFFLQVSSSIFLCKSCNGVSAFTLTYFSRSFLGDETAFIFCDLLL